VVGLPPALFCKALKGETSPIGYGVALEVMSHGCHAELYWGSCLSLGIRKTYKGREEDTFDCATPLRMGSVESVPPDIINFQMQPNVKDLFRFVEACMDQK
jgi:hypothetical protein